MKFTESKIGSTHRIYMETYKRMFEFAGEKEPPEDTGTSSAELAEIVRRFINMVERRDEKIAQLEAEIERLKAKLSVTSSN